MRRYQITILILAFCLITAAAFADSTTFKVDSYIPDQYRDLRWLVGGEIYFGGDDIDDQSRSDTEPDWRRRSDNSDRQQLQIRTEGRYRYFSVPRFLSLDFDLVAAAGRNVGDQNTESYDFILSSARYRSTASEFTVRDYQYLLDGSVLAGQYLVGDLYLASGLSFRLLQRERTTYDSEYHRVIIDSTATTVYTSLVDESSSRPDRSRERQVELTGGVGYGRVYDGRFAATALEMIDVLRESGVLTREPTVVELESLTQIIYFRRNESPIDTRYHRIDVLREIAGHLDAWGLIDGDSYNAIPLIQDVWDYYESQPREFGWRLQADLGAAYHDDQDDHTNSEDRYRFDYRFELASPTVIDTLTLSQGPFYSFDHSRIQRRNVFIAATATYYRPLSLRWQFNLVAMARYALVAAEETTRHAVSSDRPPETWHAETEYSKWQYWSVEPSLLYIYDLRTSLELAGSAAFGAYGNLPARPSRLIVREGYYYRLGLTGRYRITVPTTLSLTVSTAYWDRSYETGQEYEQFSYQIHGVVEHYLF